MYAFVYVFFLILRTRNTISGFDVSVFFLLNFLKYAIVHVSSNTHFLFVYRMQRRLFHFEFGLFILNEGVQSEA